MGDPLSAEPLRIHHVVSDIRRQDAGPSYSVPRLAKALSAHGAEVHLHALEPRPDDDPQVDTTYYRRSLLVPSLGISEAMRRELRSVSTEAEIVHFNGLWTMASVYPGWAARNTDVTLVMSPHGTLEPWARNWHRFRKNLFSVALQRRVLDRVSLFHATSDAEANSIRNAGLTTPIAVIPIGIDIPKLDHSSSTAHRSRRAVYLGRIHPAKNLGALVSAWESVSSLHPEWSLTIAGPGDPSHVSALLRSLAKVDRVDVRGATYGNEKVKLLTEADLFVLPSHGENFGIVVAEALSYGVPVIATVGTPWQGLVTEGCGWWTQPTADALAEAFSEAMTLDPEALHVVGCRGRDWMARDFSWEVIASMMINAYRWTREGGSTPPFVRGM